MKTVKKYLELIQDPEVKERALKNLQVERSGDMAKSLEHALFTAFLWHRSPEKYNYWQAIHHNIKYPNDQITVPKVVEL